jgi:dihydroxy-acid dehydratase
LIRDGDKIKIDIPAHELSLLVSEEELKKRRAELVPPPARELQGYLKRYVQHVASRTKGPSSNKMSLRQRKSPPS